jgi:DNA polymerase IV
MVTGLSEVVVPFLVWYGQGVATRKIIHVDMDAFYASVEQRDNSELRGRPVAVGHGAKRGVVAAASYEARAFGVRSAMPSTTAMRRCAELVFVPPRFDVYRAVSRQIHAIFADYTPLIEPLSLDEAYLDVTQDLRGLKTASATAKEIRAPILKETGFDRISRYLLQQVPRQAGVEPAQAEWAVCHYPGNKTELHCLAAGCQVLRRRACYCGKDERLGIRTGADLRAKSLVFPQQHFGKTAAWYLGIRAVRMIGRSSPIAS